MSILAEGRTVGLLFLMLIAFLIWYYLRQIEAGKEEKIRSIPAMEAIDEAVGRCVEIGKPVLVTYGYFDDINPAIMAGLETVGYVSKVASEKGCETIVAVGPTRTLNIAIENYRLGCIEGGRPELFNIDNVHYLTHEQFTYLAGMYGLLNEYKPGAYIGIGWYWVDAIHIGTQVKRLGIFGIGGAEKYDAGAWFLLTMNYSAFGSEIYAMGAIMSKDKTAVSGILCSDVVTWVSGAIIIIGSILAAAGNNIVATIMGL